MDKATTGEGQPSGTGAEAARASIRELAGLFLRLGTTAFGGPAAHIAMMEDEVVRRRGWLTHQEFLDMLGATNLIPGPNSTEMAIHIGYRRAGAAGLIVAGISFIVPATLIVAAIAWTYVRWGSLPAAEGVRQHFLSSLWKHTWPGLRRGTRRSPRSHLAPR